MGRHAFGLAPSAPAATAAIPPPRAVGWSRAGWPWGLQRPRTGAAAGERDHLCLISREPRDPNARGLMADSAWTLPPPSGPVADGTFRPPPPTSQAASGCRSGRSLLSIWSRCFSTNR
ncbi:hypothetical protein PVAP13_9NG075410 [Panicum virgatum]|uniref:Uncharacterized protein n=1 Tax=Panicum virgatum TaxID=38727 RepID=A0A8T0MEG9_PANVG|nr:hypothetical protein PVAP13_9NG075410 [Panicum virgatum]